MTDDFGFGVGLMYDRDNFMSVIGMRRFFGVGLVAAITLSSCQAGLKSQIQGKWKKTIENSEQVCIEEYLEKYKTTTCTLGEEKLFTVTSSYEIDSDRIVLTSSKGVKDVAKVSISGDEMEQTFSDGSAKLKRIK